MSAFLNQHHFPTIYTGTESVSDYNKGRETPADGFFAIIKERTPDWDYLLYSMYNLKEWTKKKKSPVCGCNASDVNDKCYLCEKKPLHGFEIDKYNRDIDCFCNWLLHVVLVVTLFQAHLFFPTRPIQLLKQSYCSRQTEWSEVTPHTPDQCCLWQSCILTTPVKEFSTYISDGCLRR